MDDLIEQLKTFNYDQIPNINGRRPPSGHHWKCLHCGKIAADRYGMVGPKSYMWDESCMLSALEVKHDE